MPSEPHQDTPVKLRKAFDELNAGLSNPYNEKHLHLLRDLVMQHIFTTQKHVSKLPWRENDMHTRNEQADGLAGGFFDAYEDALWPNRNKSIEWEEMLGNGLINFILAVFEIEANQWESRDAPSVLIEKLKVVVRLTGSDIQFNLEQAFDRLNSTLGSPYTEIHRQSLLDLVIETIFSSMKTVFELPLESNNSSKLAFRAEIVARTFMDWYADEIWPNRDRNPSREQSLKYDVTDLVEWVFQTKANKYGLRLTPLELVEKLKAEGRTESVQRWVDQLPLISWSSLDHAGQRYAPYAIKSLRETKSDINLSSLQKQWKREDRHLLTTGEPRKPVSLASIEKMGKQSFVKLD